MVQKSFKELFDEAKRRHGYWLAKMELEFMEKVWGSVSLKPHRKQIGRMIEETFQKVSDECKE